MGFCQDFVPTLLTGPVTQRCPRFDMANDPPEGTRQVGDLMGEGYRDTSREKGMKVRCLERSFLSSCENYFLF